MMPHSSSRDSLITLGYSIPERKLAKMNLDIFFKHVQSSGKVKVVKMDIESGNNLHVDVVLSKVTGDLVKEQESQSSRRHVSQLKGYFERFPAIIQLDPIENQRKTLNRDVMANILGKVAQDMGEDRNVLAPKHILILEEADVYPVHPLHFPIVCKPLQGGGSANAHKMGIVFNEKDLHKFQPPMILQQFHNHGGALFKVFVIGDFICTVQRDSIPNLPNSLTEAILFDSQEPLRPQLERMKQNYKETDFGKDVQGPPQETLKLLSKSIEKHFGLTIYGLDVLMNEAGQLCVIDLNYFPSYGGVEGFNDALLQLIIQKGNQKKQRAVMDGSLMLYDPFKRLVAFQSGDRSSTKHCVYIGGLTDGLMTAPYIQELSNSLQKNGWSLLQVLLSSSYSGYGTSSLTQDVEELDSLIDHILNTIGSTSIILCGYSTGCQDSVFFMKHGRHSSLIDGIIMQAPVSDRECLVDMNPEYLSLLQTAKLMIENGQSDHLMPKEADVVPITASRFFSMAERMGDDDMFSSDLTVEELQSKLGHVGVPVLIAYSMEDQYVPSHVDKRSLVQRLSNAMPKSLVCLLDANHSLGNSDYAMDEFVRRVVMFLNGLSS